MGERLVRRDVSSRISAARRRQSTPVGVRRLIKRYDDVRTRIRDVKRELHDHKRTNRQVYTVGNRLRARVFHYSQRERMLRASIGHMCIPGVPLADRYRLSPASDYEEEEEE